MQEGFAFESVRPVSPPGGYVGGKKQLAQRLAALIEQITLSPFADDSAG